MIGAPVTAIECCRVLATQQPFLRAGVVPKPATLRKWRERDLLPDRGRDRRGRALYLIADVAPLAAQKLVPRHAEHSA